MTILLNNQAFAIVVGNSTVGPLNLPQGTEDLLVTYANAAWPAVSDGTLTVTIQISDDNGQNYRDEWTDTFEHVQLSRGGVVQSTAQFGVGLQNPFGATSKLKIKFANGTPGPIATVVTVAAS